MNFNFEHLELKGLIKVKPILFKDERGFFLENYNKDKFAIGGITDNFIQDNVSLSKKNVIRGLHYQIEPFAQSKLVSVMKGEILDVVIDLRKSSKTFGNYLKFHLDDIKKEQLYIPKGFAHGFSVLSDEAVVQYKVASPYSKEHERGIIWNDNTLLIDWEVKNPILSDKDKILSEFKYAEFFQ